MMLAVATLDLERKDRQCQQIIAAFPECFSEKDVNCPLPLSFLRKQSHERGEKRGIFSGYHDLQSTGTLDEYFVPYTGFALKRGDGICRDHSYPDLPRSIPCDAKVGQVVNYKRKKWVVVENNTTHGENVMYIAPAERIDITI